MTVINFKIVIEFVNDPFGIVIEVILQVVHDAKIETCALYSTGYGNFTRPLWSFDSDLKINEILGCEYFV